MARIDLPVWVALAVGLIGWGVWLWSLVKGFRHMRRLKRRRQIRREYRHDWQRQLEELRKLHG